MKTTFLSRRFSLILTLLSVPPVTVSEDFWTKLCSKANEEVNAFIDNVLKNKHLYISDPMNLPQQDGSVSLSHGQLRGLSTLRRASDMSVSCDEQEALAAIVGKLRTDSLSMTYRWSYEIEWLYSGSGTVKVEHPNFTVFVKIIYIKSDGKDSLKIRKLEVQDLSDLHVSYTGSGSWFLPIITQFILPFFRGSLKHFIENSLLNEINNELRRIPQ